MGQAQRKELERDPNVRFMEGLSKDNGQYLEKWIKLGFDQNLKGVESKYEVKTKLMWKRKEKVKKKKDISKLDHQLKVLKLWIEQSEKRMEAIEAKEEKKGERKLLRVKVEQTEETGAGGRVQRGRQRENEVRQEEQAARVAREELEEETDQGNGELEEEQRALATSGGQRVNTPVGKHTRSQMRAKLKSPNNLFNQQTEHPALASNIVGGLDPSIPTSSDPPPYPQGHYPMVATANPAYGQPVDNGQCPHGPAIYIFRPWTEEEKKAACASIPPLEQNVEQWLLHLENCAPAIV